MLTAKKAARTRKLRATAKKAVATRRANAALTKIRIIDLSRVQHIKGKRKAALDVIAMMDTDTIAELKTLLADRGLDGYMNWVLKTAVTLGAIEAI
jgi:hypothetical protein